MRVLPVQLALALALLSGCGAVLPCPPTPSANTAQALRGSVLGEGGSQGVEAAEITLTDSAGNAIAGAPRARTDAKGQFLAPDVPPGHGYVVTARFIGQDGRWVVFKTLVRSGESGASEIELSAASTILATALTQGQVGLPGEFSATTLAQAIANIKQKLAGGDGPPLTDTQAVITWLDAQAASDAALNAQLAELRARVPSSESKEVVESQTRTQAVDPLDALKPIY